MPKAKPRPRAADLHSDAASLSDLGLAMTQAGPVARCAWTTHGARCRIPGTVTSEPPGDRPRWYCSWHHACLMTASAHRQTYEDFEAWVDRFVAGGYCCTWTHWPVAPLWAWLEGRDATADRMPCARCG